MQQAGSVESVISLKSDIAYTTSFYDCVKLCFAKGGLQLDCNGTMPYDQRSLLRFSSMRRDTIIAIPIQRIRGLVSIVCDLGLG